MVRRMMIGGGVAAVVAGAGIGAWLGSSDTIDLVGEAAAAPGDATAAAHFSACPDSAPLGALRGGDRVFAVARDETGDWFEIRSPLQPSEFVWVRSDAIALDANDELPVSGCDTHELTDDVATTTTPTSAAPSVVTSTSTEAPPTTALDAATTTVAPAPSARPQPVPGPNPAPSPSPSPAPSPTAPPRPTAAPPTAAPPRISSPTLKLNRPPKRPNAVFSESRSGVCTSTLYALTATVSANVSGASAATMSWSVGAAFGSVTMAASGSMFSAQLGPFDENTVPSGTAEVKVTITATGPGGTATNTSLSTVLHDCYFG